MDLSQGQTLPLCNPPALLLHSLPDKRALDDGPLELRSINPQGHAVRTLEGIPSLGLSTYCVGRLIDLVMPDHKAFLRVDLDRGTVSAEAFDRRQTFFRRRRGFRLPLKPVRIHAEEAHVTHVSVKKGIPDAV